ncbi:hypothetical protein GUITHDRAFT_165367, partial [Guillardia theta CCMP2712]
MDGFVLDSVTEETSTKGKNEALQDEADEPLRAEKRSSAAASVPRLSLNHFLSNLLGRTTEENKGKQQEGRTSAASEENVEASAGSHVRQTARSRERNSSCPSRECSGESRNASVDGASPRASTDGALSTRSRSGSEGQALSARGKSSEGLQEDAQSSNARGSNGVASIASLAANPSFSRSSPRMSHRAEISQGVGSNQHRDLDVLSKRIERMEELLSKAQHENARLKNELQQTGNARARGADMGEDSLGDAKKDRGVQEQEQEQQEPAVGSSTPDPSTDGGAGLMEGQYEGKSAKLDLLSLWEVDIKSIKKQRCIARGSMGTVWEATWFGSPVAVKEIDKSASSSAEWSAPGDAREEFLGSFMREVEKLCKLRHPNVVQFFGSFQQDSSMSVVTELLHWDLSPLKERLAICAQAACGLLFLHHQSPAIVHRDVKPENFLLSRDRKRVKVCDFGLARDKWRTRMNTTHTAGTLHYVAPEVHRGQDFDEKCDVYAMAMTTWEMVLLESPFHGRPEQAIPGMVGWAGERPSLEAVRRAVEEEAMAAGEGEGTGEQLGQELEKLIAAGSTAAAAAGGFDPNAIMHNDNDELRRVEHDKQLCPVVIATTSGWKQ